MSLKKKMYVIPEYLLEQYKRRLELNDNPAISALINAERELQSGQLQKLPLAQKKEIIAELLYRLRQAQEKYASVAQDGIINASNLTPPSHQENNNVSSVSRVRPSQKPITAPDTKPQQQPGSFPRIIINAPETESETVRDQPSHLSNPPFAPVVFNATQQQQLPQYSGAESFPLASAFFDKTDPEQIIEETHMPAGAMKYEQYDAAVPSAADAGKQIHSKDLSMSKMSTFSTVAPKAAKQKPIAPSASTVEEQKPQRGRPPNKPKEVPAVAQGEEQKRPRGRPPNKPPTSASSSPLKAENAFATFNETLGVKPPQPAAKSTKTKQSGLPVITKRRLGLTVGNPAKKPKLNSSTPQKPPPLTNPRRLPMLRQNPKQTEPLIHSMPGKRV